MKLDKETFIKEHFWFLLGLTVVLVLLSLVLIWTTAPSAIASQQKTFDEQKKKLEAIKPGQAKNARWVESYAKRLEAAEAQEKKIWEHAWKDQESLFTWPDGIPQEQLDVLNKLRFYDSIDSTIRTTYADGRYKSQVNELYAVVQPKVVQLGAGLRWVSQWASLPPTSEDMWLAQEDLWVQHGLLQIIRDTNDLLAALKVEKTVNERQKVFSNANWVLELTLAPVNGK